jgi:ubiquinone/menaquinone biosynthesis C-methylase UbiE
MEKKKFRWTTYAVSAFALFLVVSFLLVGPDLTKMDYVNLFSRSGWQLPNRVIDSLDIQPGDRVADIGSGDGYFTFLLAKAVGPNGRVYTVEVNDALVNELNQRARDGGYENVVVVQGEYDDPLLPDDAIDLAFLCNSYHHIKDRVGYFDRLRDDLSGKGRVAVLDMKVSFLVRLLVPAGHWTTVETMTEEMLKAKYSRRDRFDYLPAQNFAIFSPTHP